MKNITLKILIPTLFGMILAMEQAYAQTPPTDLKPNPKFDITFAEGNTDQCVFSINQSPLEMAINMAQATQEAKDCGYHVSVHQHMDVTDLCGLSSPDDGCLLACSFVCGDITPPTGN